MYACSLMGANNFLSHLVLIVMLCLLCFTVGVKHSCCCTLHCLSCVSWCQFRCSLNLFIRLDSYSKSSCIIRVAAIKVNQLR